MSTQEMVSGLVIGFVKRTLPELKYEDIDTSLSMKELGATSIDVLEVVSASMKKLEIHVPRHLLNELNCMQDLIDMLAKIYDEKKVVA